MFEKMTTEVAHEKMSTKEKILSLMKLANNNVWISSGLTPEFYNDPEVKKAVEEAIERVKTVRILIDGKAEDAKKNVSWLFNLPENLKSKVYIKVANPNTELLHWVIVDGKHFRLEKTHPRNTIGNDNLLVYNMDSSIADVLVSRYESWWLSADKVQSNQCD
jgi:phosphatidylserine/phosphatidylglycerophosphate/cardiolipin synthase-like enzyme